MANRPCNVLREYSNASMRAAPASWTGVAVCCRTSFVRLALAHTCMGARLQQLGPPGVCFALAGTICTAVAPTTTRGALRRRATSRGGGRSTMAAAGRATCGRTRCEPVANTARPHVWAGLQGCAPFSGSGARQQCWRHVSCSCVRVQTHMCVHVHTLEPPWPAAAPMTWRRALDGTLWRCLTATLTTAAAAARATRSSATPAPSRWAACDSSGSFPWQLRPELGWRR